MADVPPELTDMLSGQLFETVTIIDPDQLSDEEREGIPGWWLEASQLPPQEGIARALDEWRSTLPDSLPGFYRWLRDYGLGVFLGRSDSEDKPLLAYAATAQSGETFCWYGFPPTQLLKHPTLNFADLPAGPRAFYTQLHDGFKLASLFHNGFPSSSDLFAVGEDLDADSVEVVGDKPAPDVNQLVALFFDLGASSVCVELHGGSTNRRGGWLVSDGQLQPVDDIWTTIDRWMLSLTEP